jgi:hypothetical protein
VFFRAPNTTQHLSEVWGAVFGGDLELDRWPTFQGQLKNVFFRAPNTVQHLPEVLDAFFVGDLDLDLWPTFQGQLKNVFFRARKPHNTCRKSWVRFLEVTLTFDLLFKVNWKTCFFVPENHTTLAGGLGCIFSEVTLTLTVFQRWPWPRPLT